jgi:Protein of unknown function (DUF1360)
MAEQQRPLASYAILAGAFTGGFVAFLAVRRLGDGLPARIAPADVALLGIATHKLSRLIAKDRIAAFVRAPFAAALAGGLVAAPRETRVVAATLTTATVSDFLQAAYRRTARRDEPVAAGAR